MCRDHHGFTGLECKMPARMSLTVPHHYSSLLPRHATRCVPARSSCMWIRATCNVACLASKLHNAVQHRCIHLDQSICIATFTFTRQHLILPECMLVPELTPPSAQEVAAMPSLCAPRFHPISIPAGHNCDDSCLFIHRLAGNAGVIVSMPLF